MVVSDVLLRGSQEYFDVVYVQKGILPSIRKEDNVHRLLERVRRIARSEGHENE